MGKKKKNILNNKSFDETKVLYGLAVLVGVVAFGLALWFGYNYLAAPVDPSALVEFPDDTDEPCEYMRTIDGVCVVSEAEVNPKLVFVMIDNHMHARPPSGLSQASLVYEVPVEGNFTRFMAVFPSGLDFSKVGPVRSVRPYYLDWLGEYGDAVYMHVGGSPDALEDIETYDVNDFNEFSRGWYFWRDKNRNAPHNAYTSSDLWGQALERYGDDYQITDYSGWKFGVVEQCQEDCVTNIEVVFLPNSFDMIWEYDEETNQYARLQSGWPHKDSDGTAIVADTVIIQKVETTVLDGVGRLGMETIGSGEVIVFVGGNVIAGEWHKESRTDRTRWLDIDGSEIVLESGKIWIEVVNQVGRVEFN